MLSELVLQLVSPTPWCSEQIAVFVCGAFRAVVFATGRRIYLSTYQAAMVRFHPEARTAA
jgi:hypothetical protein